MPESFVRGLEQDTVSRMVDLLNANLADMVDLTLAVKQAHWNLKGRGYIGVHELLDEVADRLREGADLMAERVSILGGFARGTAQVTAEETRLDPYPLDLEPVEEHVEALRHRFMTVGANLREAIDAAGKAGDEGTADLFTEVSRQIDKDAWFIGANAPK